jgi:hypothetical protein
MTYRLTTKSNKIEVDLTRTQLTTTLARTGGQGTKGDSITSAYIDANNNLIIEVTASNGDVSTINAGTLSVAELYKLTELSDVDLSGLQSGDVIIYDGATQQFRNHQLTTSKVLDVDNSAKSDGALLVYNGSTEKYTATTSINNPNTLIVGGTF